MNIFGNNHSLDYTGAIESASVKITVKAKTNAKQEKVEKIDEANYIVAVKAAPIEGKANEAIMKALAKHFKIAPSKIRLISGEKSKIKRFEI